MNNEMNCLSYWFPKIVGIPGIKTPRTEIVQTKLPLWSLCDGKAPEPTDGETWHGFLDGLAEIAMRVGGGGPVFMRTGQGSGKHEWRDTCFIGDATRETIGQHVCQLVEWSELVDMLGLPTNVWVIRELLPTKPVFTAFRGMPITKERRYFIKDGKTVCRHPYWPAEAFEGRSQAPAGWRDALEVMNNPTLEEWAELTELSDRVGAVIGGDWSIDWLMTERGWYLTDMAVAGDSYHWAGCAKAELFARSEVVE